MVGVRVLSGELWLVGRFAGPVAVEQGPNNCVGHGWSPAFVGGIVARRAIRWAGGSWNKDLICRSVVGVRLLFGEL